jgi:hypothetical protein
MPVRLNGSTSGYTELSAPAVAGNNSIALPTGNGSAYQILRNGATAGSLEYADNLVLGTAQNSTSGTSIDFTGIPSWVKRVTVMFNGVSTSGTSNVQIQLGTSGGIESTGYNCTLLITDTTALSTSNSTTGASFNTYLASEAKHGHLVFVAFGSNAWTFNGSMRLSSTQSSAAMGSKTLAGTLDRVRITTANGTDTFDAGSINILYE